MTIAIFASAWQSAPSGNRPSDRRKASSAGIDLPQLEERLAEVGQRHAVVGLEGNLAAEALDRRGMIAEGGQAHPRPHQIAAWSAPSAIARRYASIARGR